MSTKENCKYYDECGFVLFRKDINNPNAIPLPKNGDCGINIDSCLRRRSITTPQFNSGPNKIKIDEYGPSNDTEFKVGWKK